MNYSKLKGFYAKWEQIRAEEKENKSKRRKEVEILKAVKREIETSKNKKGLKKRLREIVEGRHRI